MIIITAFYEVISIQDIVRTRFTLSIELRFNAEFCFVEGFSLAYRLFSM